VINKKTPPSFWAKTTEEGKPGISVYDHMINVGCVAHCIAEMYPVLLEHFKIEPTIVGALAALHDLGKISPGFQRKCEIWLEENDLSKIDRNYVWDTAMEPDHGKVSHAAIQSFLSEIGADHSTAKYVSAVLGAHHGRLNPPSDRGYQPSKGISDSSGWIDWDAERRINAQRIWDRFAAGDAFLKMDDLSPALWWLAGLTSVADWIGSDERFFQPGKSDEAIDKNVAAHTALDAIGFKKIELIPGLSFHDLFHDPEHPEIFWHPNEMQEKAIRTISGPGVYLIEAPMGMGKTEAALWAAYQLLASGKATGIYFALPTQATSNRMHLRMKEFVRRVSKTPSESRLIHGNSWLFDQDVQLQSAATCPESVREDARAGRDWFASSKRALIASFGVGTIDQALLGVVAAKHFFVRHFALAGKVVILDEVHSYDIYTGTLIDKLITTLEGLGCTVIVLSATLTGKRRDQIIDYSSGDSDDADLPYPVIAGRLEGCPLVPVSATPPNPRTVKVEFVSAGDAAEDAVALARNGGAVIWICNTIDAAQKQYQQLIDMTYKEFPVGLLHARFPFWRREELENTWMERFGKDGATRCGSILVSTQIVEQSVDLDADLMITELAPTDMLLQRLGRLWRHNRRIRQVDTARLCIIEEELSIEEFQNLEPEAIVKALGSKAHVYAPYVLLRSLLVWKQAQPKISIPVQIRQLIRSTYEELENESNSWLQLYGEWFGTDSAKRMSALRNCNIWQTALEDAEGVQTRLNELPTIPIVLCSKLTEQEAVFMDGSRCHLVKGSYQLAIAQAIHKNLVRVPEYCFDRIHPFEAFADYLYGKQCIGIVSGDGAIDVKGLKKGFRFYYSNELGLVIQ